MEQQVARELELQVVQPVLWLAVLLEALLEALPVVQQAALTPLHCFWPVVSASTPSNGCGSNCRQRPEKM